MYNPVVYILLAYIYISQLSALTCSNNNYIITSTIKTRLSVHSRRLRIYLRASEMVKLVFLRKHQAQNVKMKRGRSFFQWS